MKLALKSLLIGAMCLTLWSSCSTNEADPQPKLTSTPEATAEHDQKSGGVYKGVIIGSSGTFKIFLQGNAPYATITIDGTTKTLHPSNLDGWSSGQAISNLFFVSSEGSWKLVFSVNADGSNPEIGGIIISGHSNISTEVVKETSSSLVKAYEGRYSGAASGTWNFTVKGNQVKGIRRGAEESALSLSGSISGTTFNGNTGSAIVTGTISESTASGNWQDNGTEGTWTGKRTL